MLTHFPNMIKKELLSDNLNITKATPDEMKKAKKKVREKFIAALMLDGANRDKYGNIKRSMQDCDLNKQVSCQPRSSAAHPECLRTSPRLEQVHETRQRRRQQGDVHPNRQ